MSNVLQDIFKDHYEEMLYILHPRKSVIENVDRMINCGDPSFGEYSCAVTPQIRQMGNHLSGNAGTAYASLLA